MCSGWPDTLACARSEPALRLVHEMTRMLYKILMLLMIAPSALAETSYQDFEMPPHDYFKRTPTDRFTQMKAALESGQLKLDLSGEKEFLASFLQAMDVPASSQMLVFSTTSLQLSLINPSNPRALYFSEDIYVGYIPGGRIEIVSLDPELGAIFYIFDIPQNREPVRVERSTRCMNCHAGEETGHVPGLVVKSVLPGLTGGSLVAYRINKSGHTIPLEERLGGWYVTGLDGVTNHWGNSLGQFNAGNLVKIRNNPGERFRFARYLTSTSDILAHLIHEHQVGFVNRVIEATYRTRTVLQVNSGKLSAAQDQELNQQANEIVRYLLFVDESALPAGGIEGDPIFKGEFQSNRRAVNGAALKDLELKTRLFKHRCSYMIYSTVFSGLPKVMKDRVYRKLGDALSVATEEAEYKFLGPEEKQLIREVLRGTLKDLPENW